MASSFQSSDLATPSGIYTKSSSTNVSPSHPTLFSKETSGSGITVLALESRGGPQRFLTLRGKATSGCGSPLPCTSGHHLPLIAAGLQDPAALSSAEFVNQLPTSKDLTLAEISSLLLDVHCL